MAGPLAALVQGARLLGSLAGGASVQAAKAAAAPTGPKGATPHAQPGGVAPGVTVGGVGNIVHVHTSPPQGAPHKESAIDKAWKYDSAIGLFDRIVDKLASLTSTGVHVIQVTAVGGPLADLRRVWYLCVAAAFGRYRNRVGPTGVVEYSIECAWDVTGKTTMVTLGYTLSGLPGNLPRRFPVPGSVLPALTQFGGSVSMGVAVGEWLQRESSSGFGAAAVGVGTSVLGGTGAAAGGATRTISSGGAGVVDLIQRGPDQVTIGAAWPTFLRRVPVFGGNPDPNLGSYTPAFDGESRLVELNDYIRTRFGAAGGPSLPNVLRELPWSGNNADGPTITVPVGAVADLFRNARYHLGFEGRTGPISIIGTPGRGSPLLPDAGRVITTGEKFDADVQPPRPQIDGMSRGSLVELVTLALEQPCDAPVKVAPDATVVAPKGKRIHAPTAEGRGEVRQVPLNAVQGAVVDLGAALLIGATTDSEERTVPAINREE